MAGRVARGEIRLYAFPAPDKPRPVLVLTRSSAIGYLSWITVAPITSTIRGVPSEVVVGPDDGLKPPCVINLHNVVTVSKQQIGRRLAQLSESRCARCAGRLGLPWAVQMVPACQRPDRNSDRRVDHFFNPLNNTMSWSRSIARSRDACRRATSDNPRPQIADWPSSHSIAMNGWPSCSPIS
jgi:mRNA interferase MazF